MLLAQNVTRHDEESQRSHVYRHLLFQSVVVLISSWVIPLPPPPVSLALTPHPPLTSHSPSLLFSFPLYLCPHCSFSHKRCLQALQYPSRMGGSHFQGMHVAGPVAASFAAASTDAPSNYPSTSASIPPLVLRQVARAPVDNARAVEDDCEL